MKTERRLITVLFADIVRSSDIVKNYDPEIAEGIFSRVIQSQIDITKKHHGTVNQVMGDGIMCLFGAEPPYEEHALRAVLAGQEMIRSALELPADSRKPRASIRIGVNTGEVILVPAGNNQYRAAFQATGTAIHIADRILKKAQENQLLVSGHTKEFAERYLHFKKSSTLEWRKEDSPIHLFEPVAPKQASPLLSSGAGKKSIARFSLEERLIACINGTQAKDKPRMIWIQGAAGMGKTHLAASFIQKYGKQAYKKILQVNFYPDPLSNSENGFGQAILEGLLGGNRASILKGVTEISAMLNAGKIPFLGDCIKDIFQAPDMSAAYAALDAATRQRLKAEALAQALLAKSQGEKILLVLEDIHWAKEDTLASLGQLCHLCGGCENLLILATSRNDIPFGKSAEEMKMEKIALEPMTLRESLHFLKSLDTQKALAPSLKNKIYKLSGGNPFFMREYFSWIQASLAENTTLRIIRKRLDEHAPGTVTDILYNKLAAAGKEAAKTAKLAAVLGMRINFDVLLTFCGLDRKSLLSHLAQMEEAGIITKDRSFPAPEWTFTHELLQKVIYNAIPISQRPALHADVIRQLKKSAFKLLDNRHSVMAFHAGKSGNDLQRYVYSKWSAREENLLSRYKSSLAFSIASRQALGRMKRINAKAKHDIKARIFEISNLFITGKYSDAREHIKRLLEKKNILIKLGLLDRVLSFHALYLWIKGDLLNAAKISRTILAHSARNGRHEAYINESTRLASLYVDLGRYEEAIGHDLKTLKSMADRDSEKKFGLLTCVKPSAFSRLAYAYAELGQFKKSQKYFSAVEEFLEKSNDHFTKIYISIYLANSLLLQDRNREALELLKTAYGYCEKVNAALSEPHVLSAYGVTLARLGKTEEGEKLCHRALVRAKQNKVESGYAQLILWYAETLLAQGRRSIAIRQLKYAAALASRRHETSSLAAAYVLLGRCYQEQKKSGVSRARPYFVRALRIARKGHMLTMQKKIHALMQENLFSQKAGQLSK